MFMMLWTGNSTCVWYWIHTTRSYANTRYRELALTDYYRIYCIVKILTAHSKCIEWVRGRDRVVFNAEFPMAFAYFVYELMIKNLHRVDALDAFEVWTRLIPSVVWIVLPFICIFHSLHISAMSFTQLLSHHQFSHPSAPALSCV